MSAFRRLVVLAALLAIGWGIYGLARDVTTKPVEDDLPGVVTNLIPGVVRDLPAPCGSVFQPLEFDDPTDAVRLNCVSKLDEQRDMSLKWVGGGVVALLLALIVLRERRRPPLVLQPVAAYRTPVRPTNVPRPPLPPPPPRAGAPLPPPPPS